MSSEARINLARSHEAHLSATGFVVVVSILGRLRWSSSIATSDRYIAGGPTLEGQWREYTRAKAVLAPAVADANSRWTRVRSSMESGPDQVSDKKINAKKITERKGGDPAVAVAVNHGVVVVFFLNKKAMD
uniref:Uncharacterized protein n=1 Tax=Oryza nivara TaxID=4536 RepID=A0A0E0FF84_ORYNI